MKIVPKPFKTHRKESALQPLVKTTPLTGKAVAYEQLVTRQNLSSEQAQALLGIPQK